MTAPTLPGSIPGLLRRGSPVVGVHNALRGVVVEVDEHGAHAGDTLSMRTSRAPLSALALDLSDATGRAHAAWWAVDYCGAEALRACGLSLLEWTGIRDCATHGLNMSPASIESLRRVCLHVAGVTP